MHPNTKSPPVHPNTKSPPVHPNTKSPSVHPNTKSPPMHPNTKSPPMHPNTKSPPVHPNTAIFQLVRSFDHTTMPWKFCDDISNSSWVIVLTDRQTDKETNRHYWKQYHPHCTSVNSDNSGAATTFDFCFTCQFFCSYFRQWTQNWIFRNCIELEFLPVECLSVTNSMKAKAIIIMQRTASPMSIMLNCLSYISFLCISVLY